MCSRQLKDLPAENVGNAIMNSIPKGLSDQTAMASGVLLSFNARQYQNNIYAVTKHQLQRRFRVDRVLASLQHHR